MSEAEDCTGPAIVHHLDEAVFEHGVQYAPGWYFWDETWADRHGPYASRDEAERALARYMVEYLGAG